MYIHIIISSSSSIIIMFIIISSAGLRRARSPGGANDDLNIKMMITKTMIIKL